MVDRETIEDVTLFVLDVIIPALAATVIFVALLMLPLVGIAVCIAFSPLVGALLTVLLSLISLVIAVCLLCSLRE